MIMSKKVRYSNGYVGTVSDSVAEILTKKKEATIIGEAVKPAKPAETGKKTEADK
jgi:hypothetical protein